MKNLTLALAIACAVGLVAACGGGTGEQPGKAPAESSSNVVTAPIENAKAAVADLETAAAEKRTVTIAIEGMS